MLEGEMYRHMMTSPELKNESTIQTVNLKLTFGTQESFCGLFLSCFGRRRFWCSTGLLDEGKYVTIVHAHAWLGLVNC